MIRCHECNALFADEDADVGARGATADLGCPYCSATLATMDIHEFAESPGGRQALVDCYRRATDRDDLDDAIDRIEAFLAAWDGVMDATPSDVILGLIDTAAASGPERQLRRSDLLAVLGAANTIPRTRR